MAGRPRSDGGEVGTGVKTEGSERVIGGNFNLSVRGTRLPASVLVGRIRVL